MPFSFISTALAARSAAQLTRQRKQTRREARRRLSYQNAEYVDFSANDYLDMAEHPQVKKAAIDAIERYGVGSGGSALITGFHPCHEALEEFLADWLGYEQVLLFGSGFAANTGIVETLMTDKSALVVQDKLNHASLIDGAKNCAARSVRFRHNDMASLQKQLQLPATDRLVVTEGVFSMDGDSAPLKQIALIAKEHGAAVMVDDAHGLGIWGREGRGTPDHLKTGASVDIHMATFGKAVGTGGAFIATNKETADYLIQFCRHYIYSTAMPPALAAATLQSLKLIAKEGWRREKLKSLIAHFKQRSAALGLCADSDSAIQPIVVGDTAKALQIAEQLKNKGIWLGAIRPPTVPLGTSRLRVTLSCAHEIKDIDYLFDSLEALW